MSQLTLLQEGAFYTVKNILIQQQCVNSDHFYQKAMATAFH
ncbi:hypothetical protein C427_0060 [Paraglaciecola psychrophila 170]|jgi:hypothetical protein|uniref:Uncharacterized protein n=1 Tax=Paraglaciecola psychrophila 170 TaxID=1129794 RepID=K6ZUW3_9ALTE|nr:hypothetical protein C427_0060 [Paraglaciecola psychrophila 170]GAC39671.1 hypothetical protein GPSY_4060 [Paraglaciecola psychrophila 170]